MELQKDCLRNNDLGLLLLRLTIGGLMLFHGVAKVMGGYAFIEGMLTSMGLPAFIAWFSVAAELLGWTRAAAVVMVGNMTVAILMADLDHIFTINAATGGWAIELPMLYLLGSAVLVFTGAGKYAVTKGSILD